MRQALAATSASEPRPLVANDLPAPAANMLHDRVAAGLTAAAVLVPVIQRDEGATILFTVRSDRLRNHAGQISFPGGRREAEDAGPVANALREAREEIGLAPAAIECIGYLDDYPTGTGFRVTPVVGLIAAPPTLAADGVEVVEIFEVPLGFLLDQQNYRHHWTTYAGVRVPFYALTYGDRYIWGATAGMLYELATRAARAF